MSQKSKPKSSARPELLDIIESVGVYPIEAYEFVQLGLQHTVVTHHASTPEDESHHVSGQQLSEGLRQFAWDRWGLMARTVLARWNITSTLDFGRIVYALIDAGILSKTDSDRIEDFKNVYDFRTLDTHYGSLYTPPKPVKKVADAPQE